MPLIKSKSKKAFEKNVETEMRANPSPKDRAQNLAIAYSVKRKAAKKKMAEGGAVKDESAKTEKRPMPDEAHNDSEQESKNSGNKAPKNDDWGSTITLKQAQKPSITKLSQPKIVGSDAFSVRSRDMQDDEADLEMSEKPNEGPEHQPLARDDEEGPNRQGPKVHPMKMMAKGGPVMQPKDSGIQEKERVDESDLMDDEAPSEDEALSAAEGDDEIDQDASNPNALDMEDEHSTGRKPYASGGNVDETDSELSSRPDKGYGAIIYKPGKAEGGMIDSDEVEEDHHDSIAAAIMAKTDRMRGGSDSDEDAQMRMAEGGEVDLDLNAEEQPNGYYGRNEDDTLKENYDSDMDGISQPQDSNEHADTREADEENLHDMVSKIRAKMNMRRQFGSK